MMRVVAFDVGIVNLAIVAANVHPASGVVAQVVHVELVDTTHMEHGAVSAEACLLGHTKTHTDRLMHVIQERAWIDECDVVLIERQPLQGHTDVQEVLFLVFRHKAVLISPNSMHKHFHIQTLPYEWRKQRTVQIAAPYLQPFKSFSGAERQHDMADAMCILLFWLAGRQQKVKVIAQRSCNDDDETHNTAVASFGARMREYAYKKKCGRRAAPPVSLIHDVPAASDPSAARDSHAQ